MSLIFLYSNRVTDIKCVPEDLERVYSLWRRHHVNAQVSNVTFYLLMLRTRDAAFEIFNAAMK